MTLCDLENKVATPKLHKVIDITLKPLIYEIGKSTTDIFLKICLQAQISFTPSDLENEAAAPQN